MSTICCLLFIYECNGSDTTDDTKYRIYWFYDMLKIDGKLPVQN